MARIAYISKNFAPHVMAAINAANSIIAEYTAQEYSLTLRQIYYQFVARGLLANTQRNYKNLGSWINDGRLAGLIDWDAIEDRTRNLAKNNHWQDPEHLLEWAADGYGFDTWRDQPERVEIWVEKEALAGVIERPATEWDVSWFCCRGYVSQSELWNAAMRLGHFQLGDKRTGAPQQKPTVIHLGDHDPSGIDMTRDIFDRLELFIGKVNVERIALNMDQVEEHSPPPNPAKLTDSRAGGYVAEHGYDSWELDALDPTILNELISEAIMRHCDEDLLAEARAQQEVERERIRQLAQHLEE